ncbi:TauD/TfdA family dioxygenase [Petropleomorpha daqingensis]|uniref:Alpha-ketoglutarate-dependent taurine dioxygenase n=1 Tax=Petropleomorpha daqingensis TaxID=2026353 RepID=A0A853CN63_9ACTN|nr:TauD/TfdA family dioxygenase [Petropleomorpha daqingensis]NYJ07942.1 alpha-ketoglutarate-dependent taurine dioxygenase [Petropleomorpha daqingensis]
MLPDTALPDVVLTPGRPAVLPARPDGDLATWATNARDALRALVAEHGAVLVRGLGLRTAEECGAVIRAVTDGLTGEQEAFAPRQPRADGVWSSTPWPANQPMCMHHELSYRLEVPSLLLFACLHAPERGGSTGVADGPTVLAALPADLVARFEHEGWLLVRTYTEEIGEPWPQAFGTGDRAAVERYCAAAAITPEWLPDGGLHTRQRRRAVLPHPVTGRRCWFNQVAFLNEHTLDPEIREYLVDVYGPERLPFTTRFGGGDPIGADVVALLNEVYAAHTLREPWQDGDLLLVDNIRTAHDREAYTGARDVVAGLADPVRLDAGAQ